MTLRDEGAAFLLAVQFLTRLPVPGSTLWSPDRMAAMPRWMPAVGMLIGLLTGLAYLAAVQVFAPLLAALLSTALSLMLTGALHEDGLADTCDGLGGGATRDRALEIMRDSRIGTYGAAALGMMLGAKVLALGSLPVAVVLPALVAAHAASRASAVVVIATSAYVRDQGAGRALAGGTSCRALVLPLGIAALACLPLLWAVPAMGLSCAVAGLVLGHLLVRRWFERRLGGHTGDCLGAVQQCSEIGFLLGLLAWL